MEKKNGGILIEEDYKGEKNWDNPIAVRNKAHYDCQKRKAGSSQT